MASRRMEFFIGMMVIGIVAGVFIMTILFASERGFFVGGGGKRMTIMFERGGGINQNSLVLKNGIKIGRVYSVDLVDAEDKAEVRVGFELYPEARIYSNEYAKINRTFLGDASIEFIKNPDYRGEIVEVGVDDLIRGVPGGDLMGTVSNIEGDLAKALQNVNQAAQGLTLFMGNLNAFLGDEDELNEKKARLQTVFTELYETLSSIKSLASHMDSVVADEELNANIRAAAQEAPQILQRVDELMANANSLTGELRQTMDRAETTFDLVDRNLDNVNVFTTSLAEQGPQTMTALNESAAEVRTMVRNIGELAQELSDQIDNPSTPLGMLADEETAESLRRIVRNSEEITKKVYPILDDARVFSNKIAHRPSSLIWERNTYKGAPTTGQYGMQSKSPTGGVSSPLYRLTPSGAKVCERPYRYSPAADAEFMDPETRAAYVAAYPQAATARRDWSFDAFWNKIFAKKENDVFPRYDEASFPAVGARPVGYAAPFAAPRNVDVAVYSDFDGKNALQTASVRPTAQSWATESAFDARANQPYSTAPTSIRSAVQPFEFGLADDSSEFVAENTENAGNASFTGSVVAPEPLAPEAIGAPLPLAAPTNVSTGNGAFEDDGLPLEFAPPTSR